LLEQSLLHRLLAVAGIGEHNKAPVTIELWAELFHLELAVANKRLQGSAAVVRHIDCCQPKLAAVGGEQCAAIADACHAADVGEVADLLRTRVGQRHGRNCDEQTCGEYAEHKTLHQPNRRPRLEINRDGSHLVRG